MSIYITPWEAQTYIGLNTANDDGLLADVIDAVSRLIDNYCGDVFGPGTAGVERVFDPQSTTCIRFGPFSPLAAVTAVGVDTDDDGTFSTVIASRDCGRVRGRCRRQKRNREWQSAEAGSCPG